MFIFVNRYRGPTASPDDLTQAGFIGLIEAIDRFDNSSGYRLASYARDRIWYAVRLAAIKAIAMVAPPNRFARSAVSLNRPAGIDSDAEVINLLPSADPSPEATAEEASEARRLHAALDRLPEQERELIQRKFFGGDSASAVTADSGKSHGWAYHLEHRALRRLRAALESAA